MVVWNSAVDVVDPYGGLRDVVGWKWCRGDGVPMPGGGNGEVRKQRRFEVVVATPELGGTPFQFCIT